MSESKEEIEANLVRLINETKQFDIDAFLMEETLYNKDMLAKLEEHIKKDEDLKETLQSKIMLELELENEAGKAGKEFDQIQWKAKKEADHKILALLKRSGPIDNNIQSNLNLMKQAITFHMDEQKKSIKDDLIDQINEKKKIDAEIEQLLMLV